jgi:hypothetical protein
MSALGKDVGFNLSNHADHVQYLLLGTGGAIIMA